MGLRPPLTPAYGIFVCLKIEMRTCRRLGEALSYLNAVGGVLQGFTPVKFAISQVSLYAQKIEGKRNDK